VAPRCRTILIMGTRFAVFALLISLIVQSVLTISCGPDGLGLAIGDEAPIVAADAPGTASAAEYCSRCGGLRTATGCCAHGLPLAAVTVEVPEPFLALNVSAADDLSFPQGTPPTLFRPPIPV
jgi:hypothetical protein